MQNRFFNLKTAFGYTRIELVIPKIATSFKWTVTGHRDRRVVF